MKRILHGIECNPEFSMCTSQLRAPTVAVVVCYMVAIVGKKRS
jgi:hypothetical protein